MSTKTDDAIPAGSFSPADVEAGELDTTDVVEAPAADPVATDPEPATPVADPKEDQFQNAQKLIGKQGAELGELRKIVESQSEMLKGLQPKVLEGPSLDEQLAEIQAQVDAGELDYGEALLKSSKISQEFTRQEVSSVFEQNRSAEQSAKVQQEFHKKYPDFAPTLESGQLEVYKADNPIHDDFSAYLEHKLQQGMSDVEAKIAAAKEEGRTEGAKLAQADKAAGKVLGKSGVGVRDAQPTSKSLGKAGRQSLMESALAKVRGA
jgi:hypothetical protein